MNTLFLADMMAACTEATGYVHGTTLKWALAKRGRLYFNANIRLFNGSGGPWGINGWLSNAVFSILLIIPYTATNLSFVPCFNTYDISDNGEVMNPESLYRWDIPSIPLLTVGFLFSPNRLSRSSPSVQPTYLPGVAAR